MTDTESSSFAVLHKLQDCCSPLIRQSPTNSKGEQKQLGIGPKQTETTFPVNSICTFVTSIIISNCLDRTAIQNSIRNERNFAAVELFRYLHFRMKSEEQLLPD